MTIPRFGKITPVHGMILSLIGYSLQQGIEPTLDIPDAERLHEMREGHRQLIQGTGQDYGYDLGLWREYLMAYGEETGYTHPYAFSTVDEAVQTAIDDPGYQRLAKLAAGGEET